MHQLITNASLVPIAEMPAVPIPNAEDSDSDYEHYDFSSKPPMALSTFYSEQPPSRKAPHHHQVPAFTAWCPKHTALTMPTCIPCHPSHTHSFASCPQS